MADPNESIASGEQNEGKILTVSLETTMGM